MDIERLNHELGNMDLNLLDQLLKGRFSKGQKILEAGCGEGRNLTYFIKNNYDVYGFDKNPDAIKFLNLYSKTLNPHFDTDAFIVSDLEAELPYPPEAFDVILCFSVFHFAKSETQFLYFFDNLYKHLIPNGIFMFFMKFREENENVSSDFYFLEEKVLKKMIKKYNFKFVENQKNIKIKEKGSFLFAIIEKV